MIKVIVTGATGMVGEGVLHECLNHVSVEQVLVINRRPCGVSHPKLAEIIHEDFFDLSPIEDEIKGYDACLFCLGVSSIGMSEDEYAWLTYTLTMHMATLLSAQNPQMTFCYISGSGTDSSERGRIMWARVKGRTENSLLKLPFKKVYLFRPAVITPTRGLKNTLKPYKYFGWLIPVIKLFAPAYVCSLRELGLAMIHASIIGFEKSVVEGKDIGELAGREVEGVGA